MDRTLNEALRLLNDYKPKEALLKLSELERQSQQSILLKEQCETLLRQQLLYLLKEVSAANDYKGMEVLVCEYQKFLGIDEYCEVYDDKLSLHKKSEEEKEKEKKDTMLGCVISILFTVVFLFAAIMCS